jgi:hypothetical protein
VVRACALAVVLTVALVARARRTTRVIQADEAAVGITVVIATFDLPTVTARRIGGAFDASLISPAGTADSDRQPFPSFATTGSINYSGYTNPRVDLILANGRKATNPTDPRTLDDTAERIILQDRPIIVLYHGIKLFAISSSVAGCSPTPTSCRTSPSTGDLALSRVRHSERRRRRRHPGAPLIGSGCRSHQAAGRGSEGGAMGIETDTDLNLDPQQAESVVGGAARREVSHKAKKATPPVHPPRMIVVTGTHTPGDTGAVDPGPDPSEDENC